MTTKEACGVVAFQLKRALLTRRAADAAFSNGALELECSAMTWKRARPCWHLAATLWLFCLTGTARAADTPATAAPASRLPEGPGLAAKHPGDAGIGKEPAVFFADDFESGDLKRWDDRGGTIAVTDDKPHAGGRCAVAEMHKGKDAKMDKYWGNAFFPPGPGKGKAAGAGRVMPPLDRWQCWEFMLQANTAPDKADGRQAMWVDGKLVGDFTGIRWRNDLDLKVNCLWLEHYGYDESDPTRQFTKDRQAVWFDDVVVAREYVGPMGEEGR